MEGQHESRVVAIRPPGGTVAGAASGRTGSLATHAVLGLGLGVAAWYLIGLPHGYLRQVVADALFVLLPALAAVLCLRASRWPGPVQRAWRFIGLGCAVWSLGSVAWGVYDVVLREPVPYPSLADVGYILIYPFCCAGLAIAIRQSDDDGPPVWEMLLDALLVLAGAAAVGYQALLAPVLTAGRPLDLSLATSVLWQGGTVSLLFLSLFALAWCPGLLGRRASAGLIVGCAAFAVANVAYGRLALTGSYEAGQLIDLGWHEGFVAIALGALWAARAPAPLPASGRVRRRELLPRTIATVVSVLAAAGLAAAAVLRPGNDPVVAAIIVAVGLLVAGRLGLAVVQAQQLEQRTRERDRLAAEAATASVLAEANAALRAEQAFSASLIDNHADGVFAFDRDYRITAWNPWMAASTGLPAERALGRSAFDVLPFIRETGDDRCFAAALDGRLATMPAQPNRVADGGRDGYYEANYAPLRDAASAVIGGICVVRDVTERMEAEAALRDAEARYRTLIEHLPVVVYVADCDDDWTTQYMSPGVEAVLGYSAASLVGDPRMWAAIVHPEDRGRVRAASSRSTASGEPFRMEYRLLAADGRVVWVRDAAVMMRDDDGQPRCWQGVFLDITAEKAAEAELALERDLLRALMDNVPDFVYFKDTASRFVRLNPSTARSLGVRDPGQAVGKTDVDFFPDGAAWVEEERRVLRDGESIVNRLVDHLDADGGRRWVLSTKVPLRDPSGEIVGLVGLGRDVTELKELEERMAHQAFHDPLTGLPNRTLFHDRLEHALRVGARREEAVAVLFMDLDGFKLVNDSFGHEAGDALLIAVGRRLSAHLRDGDTLARLGGDEFGAILEGVRSADAAREAALRLLGALEAPIAVDGRELVAGASIGIALSRSETGGPGDLLREADVALYRAKGSGRRQAVVFEADMAAAVAARVTLEADLRQALARGELELHYQPIVELASDRVVGAEALLRWTHPARGPVSPTEFVPLAEETGLILPIGKWVLAEACRQAAGWQPTAHGGPPIAVSVNLSARQFHDPTLVAEVAAVLAATGLPAAALMLEITEHALLDDNAGTAATLAGLSALGVGLAIDDFGTGYSSLGYLRNLPVTVLKTDRVFVRALGPESGGAAIVEAIVALAHALGMRVTAEGVETAEQVAFLSSVGCDHGQGFLFAPALAAPAFADLLASGGRQCSAGRRELAAAS